MSMDVIDMMYRTGGRKGTPSHPYAASQILKRSYDNQIHVRSREIYLETIN